MNVLKKIFSTEVTNRLILHTPMVSIVYALSMIHIFNASDYPVSIIEIALSLSLLTILTVLCFVICALFLKDRIKSSVAATFFLFFSFNASMFAKSFFDIRLLPELSLILLEGNEFITSILLVTVAMLLIIYVVHVLPGNLVRLNKYLNILFVIFLVFEIIRLFTFEPKRIVLSNKVEFQSNQLNGNSEFPDIYYIIFDSYTNFESLKKYWNYDNAELKEFLAERNFYLAERSRSNYNQTHFTIASVFNLSYLHYESFNELTIAHYPNLFQLIRNNVLVKILKDNGYKFINYSFFDIANKPRHFRIDVINEPGFFKNTILKWILNIDNFLKVLSLSETPEPYYSKLTQELLTKAKEITNSKSNSPFFAYIHFIIPHSPYYFDAKGNLMPADYANDETDKWKYLEQLKYSNKVLMEVVDHILNTAKQKPIIIIQGDHGFRQLEDKKEQGAESHSMLNAFYFPDGDYKALYENISSVNTFRVLLNKLNLTDVELLPDKSFFVAKGIGF